MIHNRSAIHHRLPPVVLARPLGRARRLGDLLSDATNIVNDVTGNSSSDTTDTSTDTSGTDTSGTDTSGTDNTVQNNTGVSTPIPTGLAAVPVWVWIGGAGLAGYALYEFVLRK